MSKTSLERVKRLTQQLSPEDRVQLFAFIVESFDSETPALDGSKEIPLTTVGGENFILLATGTTAVIMYKGRQVFRLVFDPEAFRRGRMEMPGWKDAPLTAAVKKRDPVAASTARHS
jgi:hypothetical protein